MLDSTASAASTTTTNPITTTITPENAMSNLYREMLELNNNLSIEFTVESGEIIEDLHSSDAPVHAENDDLCTPWQRLFSRSTCGYDMSCPALLVNHFAGSTRADRRAYATDRAGHPELLGFQH